MTTSTFYSPAPAGADRTRAAHAVAKMISGEAAKPDAGMPAGYVRCGRVLVAALRADEPIPHATIEQLDGGRGLDLIAAHFDPTWVRPPIVTVGVRLSWKMLCHPSFHLWLPRDAGPARLVPVDSASRMQFRITDGRVDCWAETALGDEESGRGCDAATLRLRQLMAPAGVGESTARRRVLSPKLSVTFRGDALQRA